MKNSGDTTHTHNVLKLTPETRLRILMLMERVADSDFQIREILKQAVSQKTGQEDTLDLVDGYLTAKHRHQALVVVLESGFIDNENKRRNQGRKEY